MDNLQNVARDMRRSAEFFKGIIAAADVVERLGSLENATNEAKAALAVAERNRDSALTELADVKAKGKAAVADAKAKAESIVADAMTTAQAYADKSRAEIDTYNQANTDAAVKFAGAQVDAANTVMAKATMERDALAAHIASLAAEVADLESKRAASQAELDKLTKALDKIKSQFKIEG